MKRYIFSISMNTQTFQKGWVYLSISGHLWYLARVSHGPRPTHRAMEQKHCFADTQLILIAWEDQRHEDNERCGKERFFREIRSSLYESRVKMAESARARCLLQSTVSVDQGWRCLKVVDDRENKRQRGGRTANVSANGTNLFAAPRPPRSAAVCRRRRPCSGSPGRPSSFTTI